MSTKPSKNKPVKQQPGFAAVHHQKHEFYSGPVPKPEDLERYNLIQPGFADRIITMAEKEQDDRLLINHKLVDNSRELKHLDLMNHRRGQWFAISTVVILTALCVFFVYMDKASYGRDIVVSACVAMVGLFLTKKVFPNKSNQEEK